MNKVLVVVALVCALAIGVAAVERKVHRRLRAAATRRVAADTDSEAEVDAFGMYVVGGGGSGGSE